MKTIFDDLKKYCPSGFVTRKELQKLTGGLIHAKTIANLDSQGIGIKNKSVIGSKVIYRIDDVIAWLEENTKLIGFEEEQPVKKTKLSIIDQLLTQKRVYRRANNDKRNRK